MRTNQNGQFVYLEEAIEQMAERFALSPQGVDGLIEAAVTGDRVDLLFFKEGAKLRWSMTVFAQQIRQAARNTVINSDFDVHDIGSGRPSTSGGFTRVRPWHLFTEQSKRPNGSVKVNLVQIEQVFRQYGFEFDGGANST